VYRTAFLKLFFFILLAVTRNAIMGWPAFISLGRETGGLVQPKGRLGAGGGGSSQGWPILLAVSVGVKNQQINFAFMIIILQYSLKVNKHHKIIQNFGRKKQQFGFTKPSK